jgi:hypothetical protein
MRGSASLQKHPILSKHAANDKDTIIAVPVFATTCRDVGVSQ